MSQYVAEVSDDSFEKNVLQSDVPVLVDWSEPIRLGRLA
jgi:hypothetical protein